MADDVVQTLNEDGKIPSAQLGKVEQILPIAAYPATIGGNQTGFLRIFQSSLNISSIENRNKCQMPKCTVKALNGRCEDASSDITLTVRKNGVDTGVTGTVNATGTFRLTGTPVDFAKGDEFSLAYSTTVGGGNALNSVVAELDAEVA